MSWQFPQTFRKLPHMPSGIMVGHCNASTPLAVRSSQFSMQKELPKQVPKSSRPLVLLLCATVAFAIYYATSGITPSFASEGDTASQEDEVPTLESLTERIAGLENRIAELELNQNEIAAQGLAYLLDQVDIHALHERLHEGDGIMPGDSGQYKRLVHLLSAVDFPPELAEEGTALVETLTQLASALADDDLESAIPLASAAHEAQHHFSSNVADWFDLTLIPVEEDPDQADQSDDCIKEESEEDSHGHGDDSDDSDASDDDSDNPCDDDDSNETHDDGHDHNHGG